MCRTYITAVGKSLLIRLTNNMDLIKTSKQCFVLCCLVLSCLVLSCLVLSCLVLSCSVLSCPVLSCPVLSVSCPVLSSSCLLSYRIVSSQLISSHLVSSRLVSSCLVLSWQSRQQSDLEYIVNFVQHLVYLLLGSIYRSHLTFSYNLFNSVRFVHNSGYPILSNIAFSCNKHNEVLILSS